jgi:hypothetical protein
MKMQLKFLLLLFGVSFICFMGCKKNNGVSTTITGTYTSSTPTKTGFLNIGTFTTTGGIKTSGSTTMNVNIVGDSAHCTASFTEPEGTFSMTMNCSLATMTGHWNIYSGTGRYVEMRGDGSLTMMFPPNTPIGVAEIESMTGVVWLHP